MHGTLKALTYFGLVVVLVRTVPSHATLITIDPADYPDNTALSGLFDTVELSTAQGSVEVIDTAVSEPLMLISDSHEPVFVQGNLFAHSGGSIWSAGQCCGGDTVLRADFLVPVKSVSWLFIPNDIDTGFLQIYNPGDRLIDESIFRDAAPFSLTLSADNIAYALATFGDTGRIGQVTFDAVPVPEPTTLSLLGAGLLAMCLRRHLKARI